MSISNDSKTAIIIGAGPAGLTAAYQLLKETNVKPIIVEKTEKIGGISRTEYYKGNRMDMGGHRFFSKSEQVNRIWRELMSIQGLPSKDDRLLGIGKPLEDKGPDPEKEDRVLLIRNRISRIFYLRKFFDYPISIKPETFINMGFWRTIKVGIGLILSTIFKRKEKSLEDFYINRFGKPLYSMFFEDYTEKLWGIHPSQISPEWGAQRVKELSLSKAIFEMLAKVCNSNYKTKQTSLIEQFIYPKRGPGQLWEIMAEEIVKMGGEIYFNENVIGLVTTDNHISQVRISNSKEGERELTGDYVLSTMPVKGLVEALGRVVPQRICDIAGALPYRDFITVGLLVKKLNIKNKTKIKTIGNIVPDCWIYIQERDVRIGRLQIFNNWSPYMVKDNEETVWLGLEYFCNEGDFMWNMADQEFIEFAVDELSQIAIISKDMVLDATIIRVEKAYPAYFGTYKNFNEVREFLNRYQNLYCMGRNGQHRYNNMDHSMVTAIETVNLIKNGSHDKSTIWNVNTEEEYHEEK